MQILGASDISTATAQLLAEWLTDGKPEMGWKGDPRLELHIGVLTAKEDGIEKRTGRFRRRGDVCGHRFEVRRHLEDGRDTTILSRSVEDWHEIIPELVKMDPRTPGHEGTFALVERANAAIEKKKDDEWRELNRDQAEYTARLAADIEYGPNTFRQVGGLRDEK